MPNHPVIDDVEIWKPVVGYEDFYSVSNHGRVRREKSITRGKAGTILRPTRNDVYPAVDLCRDGKRQKQPLHKLVTEAFLGPRPPNMVVNHIDGVKHNPRLSNLEYGTHGHNAKEAYRLGLKDAQGEKNGRSRFTNEQILEIRSKFTGRWGDCTKLAREYGACSSTIGAIVRRRAWAHL
jgi:hypothetical protein